MCDVLTLMKTADIERFWSKIDIKGEGECWNWISTKSRDGYGVLGVGGRNGHKVRAHRIARVLTDKANIPDGMLVRHTCDNPTCCNPKHLVNGTQQDNMDDMKSRDRSAVSYGNSALNWGIVDEIRLSKEPGTVMAKKHKISKATVSEIRNFKTWREEHRHVAKGLS